MFQSLFPKLFKSFDGSWWQDSLFVSINSLDYTCKAINMHEKQKFFISVHTNARWVKPAQSGEPIFLTRRL